MARITPQVRDGVLDYHVGVQRQTIQLGSDAWQHWLADPQTTTFRFVHPQGSFTARKEQRRRGGSYWYAYRTQGGRLRKGYLGRAEQLTPQRLAEVATRLAGGHPTPGREPAVPSRDESPARQLDLAPDTGLPPDALLATKLFLPPPAPTSCGVPA